MISRLTDLRISLKLPIIVAVAALTLAAGIGFGAYRSASHSASVALRQKLSAVLEDRSEALQQYLASIEQDMHSVAANPFTLSAVQEFVGAWRALKKNQTQKLQSAYITANPHPTGEKENLDAAPAGTLYDGVHATYHPWFRTFLRQRGYYDIFLFDLSGNLVYTVFKELDYATNLNTGKYKSTDLGNAFRAGRDASSQGAISFFDFKPYAPSHGAAASFISTPLYDSNNKKVGVLVFQMPIARINKVMKNKAGLGEGGETFIVGEDGLMRSDSRFSENTTILRTKIESGAVDQALNGSLGISEGQKYQDVVADIYAIPFAFHGAKWALAAVVDNQEVNAPVKALGKTMALIAAGLLVVVSGLGLYLTRGITGALSGLTHAMRRLAEGDTDVELSGSERGDEIGEMTRAVAIFRDNAIERDRLEAEQRKDVQARTRRQGEVDSLIRSFDESVTDVLRRFRQSTEQMDKTARALTGIADEASSRASAAADGSMEAADNVQSVASAAEQLSTSINEIGQSAARSSEVVARASDSAADSNAKVQGLAEAAHKIGAVIGLIQDIAEQTNLLALNATIEAARAGDSGRGFAVVANEVKSLANQTARATDEISQQIAEIQGSSADAAQAIQVITETMGDVRERTAAIAAAVEEQDSATDEIARNVKQAADRTSTVGENIGGVTSAVRETTQSASEVMRASEEMAQQSAHLRQEVDRFLKAVAAA